MWMHNGIVYAYRSLEDEQLLKNHFAKKKKHGGQLTFKIHILFYGDDL
jgi:hypothetical protein